MLLLEVEFWINSSAEVASESEFMNNFTSYIDFPFLAKSKRILDSVILLKMGNSLFLNLL